MIGKKIFFGSLKFAALCLAYLAIGIATWFMFEGFMGLSETQLGRDTLRIMVFTIVLFDVLFVSVIIMLYKKNAHLFWIVGMNDLEQKYTALHVLKSLGYEITLTEKSKEEHRELHIADKIEAHVVSRGNYGKKK